MRSRQQTGITDGGKEKSGGQMDSSGSICTLDSASTTLARASVQRPRASRRASTAVARHATDHLDFLE